MYRGFISHLYTQKNQFDGADWCRLWQAPDVHALNYTTKHGRVPGGVPLRGMPGMRHPGESLSDAASSRTLGSPTAVGISGVSTKAHLCADCVHPSPRVWSVTRRSRATSAPESTTRRAGRLRGNCSTAKSCRWHAPVHAVFPATFRRRQPVASAR